MSNYDLYQEHMEMFETEQQKQDARTDGCTCRVTMTNAGTSGMYLGSDTYGCPLHCNHKGINQNGEWWCACGASHED